MKFQDSSFNDLKVTVGTKSVTHARTPHACSKSNLPHQLFKVWGIINFFKVGGKKYFFWGVGSGQGGCRVGGVRVDGNGELKLL